MPRVDTIEPYLASEADVAPTPTIGERIDFAKKFLRRRYLLILICVVLALPVGAYIQHTGKTTYIASSTMMIETRRNPLQESLLGDAPLDGGWIESQIGILRSQNVAAYVVRHNRHTAFSRTKEA